MRLKVLERGAQNFLKSRNHPKILGIRNVTGNEFYGEDPQMLGVTITNLVARGDLVAGLVQPGIGHF